MTTDQFPLDAAPDGGFDAFDFDRSLNAGLKAAGFEQPRPIQAATIAAALDDRDVLGLAQTGTGKTAAFALPVLERLIDEPGRSVRALILAPTRELATQIASEVRMLAKYTKLKVATLYGGIPTHKHVRDLKQQKPQIVVGCPGRVLDLLGQDALDLSHVETLVLDEADHMFDMGFLPDIRRILKQLPDDRQNLLFSATMPREIRKLADDVLNDPHVVELAGTAPAETVDHGIFTVEESRKRDLLEHLLGLPECTSAIVFTRTKHRARRVATQLRKAGFRAADLQGNMSQSQRDRAMRGFRTGRHEVLVATDIAARGIDVQNVSHVVNYDVPNTSEAYTHRIGRTGRSENTGIARTFVTPDNVKWLQQTERMIGEPIPRCEAEGFEPLPIDTTPPKPAAKKKGRRRPPRSGSRRRTTKGSGGGTGGGNNRGKRPRRSSRQKAAAKS